MHQFLVQFLVVDVRRDDAFDGIRAGGGPASSRTWQRYSRIMWFLFFCFFSFFFVWLLGLDSDACLQVVARRVYTHTNTHTGTHTQRDTHSERHTLTQREREERERERETHTLQGRTCQILSPPLSLWTQREAAARYWPRLADSKLHTF